MNECPPERQAARLSSAFDRRAACRYEGLPSHFFTRSQFDFCRFFSVVDLEIWENQGVFDFCNTPLVARVLQKSLPK